MRDWETQSSQSQSQDQGMAAFSEDSPLEVGEEFSDLLAGVSFEPS